MIADWYNRDMVKLNAKQLRVAQPDSEMLSSVKKNPITIIVDDVLDTYNVGSIFRLAEAVAVEKVYLCGQTLTPPNSRIKKASINTWQLVDWEYKDTAIEAIEAFKKAHPDGSVYAIEQNEKSIPFQSVNYRLPIAIVIGNETVGVSKEVLEMVDTIVELPMYGINVSLNVMVCSGIILYEIMRQQELLKSKK